MVDIDREVHTFGVVMLEHLVDLVDNYFVEVLPEALAVDQRLDRVILAVDQNSKLLEDHDGSFVAR